VIANRVVIRGHAPSYYHKQLVLQGVLDVIDSKEAAIVEFNVEVEASTPKPSPLRL
jgi:hypothetical protein